MSNEVEALRLWTTVAPYSGYQSKTIANRLLPAIRHNRIRHYRRSGKYIGFITWAWFTKEEFESDTYYGPEVFARDHGDFVVLVDMIAPGGRNDVLSIVKEARRFLSEKHPGESCLLARREGRVAKFTRRG